MSADNVVSHSDPSSLGEGKGKRKRRGGVGGKRNRAGKNKAIRETGEPGSRTIQSLFQNKLVTNVMNSPLVVNNAEEKQDKRHKGKGDTAEQNGR